MVGLTLKNRVLALVTFILIQAVTSAEVTDTEDIAGNLVIPKEEDPSSDTTAQMPNDNTEIRIENPRLSDDTTATHQENKDEIIQTTGGPVIGTTTMTSEGKEVSVYYGIPYAAPPTGSLRFRPPVRVAPWTTPMMAIKPATLCYQQLRRFKVSPWVEAQLARPWTEDCLTLTIWAPRPKTQGAPVLVNIHGGGFMMGSSLMFTDGTAMAAQNVILVSLNYRVGVFGFFGLGHPDAPGNVGLMDQTLALQWVQENVATFGGDPGRVTLIGVSAGGSSVGYHLLSPMSRGLFSGAILMGGSPNNPFAVSEAVETVRKSNTLLVPLGCAGSNFSLSLDCIRKKDAEDVLEMADLPGTPVTESLIPTVDGHFMTEHPEICLEGGRIASPVPVIIGTAENEGAVFMARGLRNPDGRVFRRDFQKMLQGFDNFFSPLQAKALDVLYTNWSNPDDPYLLRDAVRDFYGDYLVVCGANKLADGMAKAGSTVYRYVLGYPIAFGFVQLPSWMGATHGGDFGPILGPKNIGRLSENDVAFVEKFRQRIMNFIKTRNPNENMDDASDEAPWPEYDVRHGTYYNLALKSRIGTSLRARQCRMLEDLLPSLASAGKNC